MGHSISKNLRHRISKPPPSHITIHYSILPDRRSGQSIIDFNTSVEELHAFLSKLISLNDKRLTPKFEYKVIDKWLPLDSAKDWDNARKKFKTKKKESLHIRVIRKPVPLYKRRFESDRLAVNVPQALRAKAKPVAAVPAANKVRTHSVKTEGKINNDELFNLILHREPELKYYLHSKNVNIRV